MVADPLRDNLPVAQRLALTYVPPRAEQRTLALLSLDARLAEILRTNREPMLAQVKLAWWRERLAEPAEKWPQGEPLIAALHSWDGHARPLIDLVDGWECLIGDAPLPLASFCELAEARASAFAALAHLFDGGDAAVEANARRMARDWALADLARHVSHPEETRNLCDLARSRDWTPAWLPRELRSLAVLHGFARRAMARPDIRDQPSAGDVLAAFRIGIFGR